MDGKSWSFEYLGADNCSNYALTPIDCSNILLITISVIKLKVVANRLCRVKKS